MSLRVKKVFTAMAVAVMMMLMAAALAACDLGGRNEPDVPAEKEYVVQYTDDDGVHQISVKDGYPFAITEIPQRFGYEFTGLFDAESGGVQYVNAQGASLAPFTDKKNMVLFPQFKAKEYTVIFDYAGATQVTVSTMKVLYGEELLYFPTGLGIDKKIFQGWYTAPNCGGVKVAESDGRPLGDGRFTDELFTSLGESATITVYAGFKWQPQTVKFCYSATEEVVKEVEYGTAVRNISLPARADGRKVTQWKLKSGEAFDGIVTQDLELVPDKWDWTASFSRTNQELITEDGFGPGKNYFDKVSVTNMFGGLSVGTLMAAANAESGMGGFKTVSVTIILSVHEIDDGYQWIKVCSYKDGKDYMRLLEQRFEHGPGKKDQNSYTHTFTFSTDLANFTDQINVYYDGQGDWDDDWVCESMKITITLHQ